MKRRWQNVRGEVLFVSGALFLIGGIAHYSHSIAFMVAGGMLMVGGYLLV